MCDDVKVIREAQKLNRPCENRAPRVDARPPDYTLKALLIELPRINGTAQLIQFLMFTILLLALLMSESRGHIVPYPFVIGLVLFPGISPRSGSSHSPLPRTFRYTSHFCHSVLSLLVPPLLSLDSCANAAPVVLEKR